MKFYYQHTYRRKKRNEENNKKNTIIELIDRSQIPCNLFTQMHAVHFSNAHTHSLQIKWHGSQNNTFIVHYE